MYKYEKIFKQINTNYIDIKPEYYVYLKDYLCFLDVNESFEKINNIAICLYNNYTQIKKPILYEFNLEYTKKIDLISLIIFKAINKPIVTPNSNNEFYATSDEVLNEIIETYKNLYIFYFRKEVLNNELISLRGEFFRIIKILILNNLILFKKSNKNLKTTEYWFFENKILYFTEFCHFKILINQPSLVIINENYYIIGDFFSLIKKVFISNILSNQSFKLNDITYVEKIAKNKFYLNVRDLNDIVVTISNLSVEETKDKIVKQNELIRENIILLKKLKSELKILLNLKISTSFLASTFLETKQKLIEVFIKYLNTFINEDCFKDYTTIINYMYNEFIKMFKNSYLKLEFKNNDELFEFYKNINKWYPVDEINDVTENKEPENNNLIVPKKTKEKINPSKISFLTYLIIFSKKEIDNVIKKTKKKLNKIANLKFANEVNLDIIEFFENLYLDQYNTCLIISKKFNLKTTEDSKIFNLTDQIKKLILYNKKIISDISKSMHIYNILLLNNYCKNNELMLKKIDKFDNILVYFLFYFDFRGRFYYDSPISPTTSKISRYIYNYGIFDKKNYEANEISTIIKEYQNYINDFKQIHNITENSNFINDSLFWVMISLGKLIIKKKIKIKITEFLDNALNIKEKPVFSDIIDEIEYKSLIKIINSLEKPIILKRGMLKDATASFFQNLIRILGPKNDEISKMGNLLSNEAWYDWYTYVLNLWIKQEIIDKTYNEKMDNIFIRKVVKKIIMTVPYAATFKTLLKYFQEELVELNIEYDEEIFNAFLRFYKFLKTMFKNNEIFIKNPQSMNEDFEQILKKGEEIIITSRIDDISNITYNKTHTKHFDFIITTKNVKNKNVKIRVIKNYKVLDNSIDKAKTCRASNANVVHFVDAVLIRDINEAIYYKNKKYYISIHDCFIVDFTKISEFISIVNNEINNPPFKENITTYEKKFFSIFVFI